MGSDAPLTSPTPAGEELPNMKFSFARLGAGAPVEHVTRGTESGKASREGFGMHTRLSLPEGIRLGGVSPVPTGSGQHAPRNLPSGDGKNLQGLETAFPRRKGKSRLESG